MGPMRLAVYACYFVTGAFGLGYEVVWSRYLALLVGSTAYAHAAVLAAFMGGLALGATVFGPLADRVKSGLSGYGWMEVGVGLFGALFPSWFGVCEALADALYGAVTPGTPLMGAAKLLLALLCVLPPAVLMGGTLPLLTKALASAPSALRSSVAGLYATNAAGAAFGGLVTGLWAVGALGLPGSVTGLGILNTLLGIAIVYVARRVEIPTETVEGAEDAREYDPGTRRLALVLATFSGFSTMALEVAWIRYGVLILGSSTHSFSLMLAAFVTGISAGAYVVATPRAGRWRLQPLLAGSLLATALALTVFLALYPRLPYTAAGLLRTFAADERAFAAYQVAVYTLCFVAMFVPAAVAGMVLPICIRLATVAGEQGARLGRVYAANTAGTLLGATLTGLVLFSLVGVESLFRFVLVAYALAAAYVAFRNQLRAVAVAALLLGGLHPVLAEPTDPRLLNGGLYRRAKALAPTWEQHRDVALRGNLLHAADGPHATVTVQKSGDGVMLVVNGKPDASTHLDMPTQVLLGHLPMLFHPNAKDAFVVGLGSGVTAGAILAHPDTRVTVAEISPEVVAAVPFFEPHAGKPLENPRTRLVVDDARTLLRADEATYDVIVSEPTNPWQAGVAGLFTVEFYDLARSRLRPGGIFAQWIQSYEISDPIVGLMVSTLLARFPNVVPFEVNGGDYVLLASDHPIELDPDAFAARVARVAPDLARVHADRPFVVLALQSQATETLREALPVKEYNSDAFQQLELLAPEAFFASRRSEFLARIDDRLRSQPPLLVDRWLAAHPLEPADVETLAAFTRATGSPVLGPRMFQLARRVLGPAHPLTDSLYAAATPMELLEVPIELTTTHARVLLGRSLAAWEATFLRFAPPEHAGLDRLVAYLEAQGEDVSAQRKRLQR